MKNIPLTLIAALTVALAGCKEKAKSESTETSKVNGTTIERTTSVETTVDDDGNTSRTTETKTTVDPEGMMNKETVEETKTEESR